MSGYLVILHDAEPASDEGRATLKRELIEKLGIGTGAVEKMFSSLPVILKEDISRQHAEDYLRVLEALGANVEILSNSNDSDDSDEESSEQDFTESPDASTREAVSEASRVELDDYVQAASTEDDDSLGNPEDHSLEDLEGMLDDMLGPPPGTSADSSESSADIDPLMAALAEASAEKPFSVEDSFIDLTTADSAEASAGDGAALLATTKEPAKPSVSEGAQSVEDLEALLNNALQDKEAQDSESDGDGMASLEAELNKALVEVERAERNTAAEPAAETGSPTLKAPATSLSLELEESDESKPTRSNIDFDANLDSSNGSSTSSEAQDEFRGDVFDLSNDSIQAVAASLDTPDKADKPVAASDSEAADASADFDAYEKASAEAETTPVDPMATGNFAFSKKPAKKEIEEGSEAAAPEADENEEVQIQVVAPWYVNRQLLITRIGLGVILLLLVIVLARPELVFRPEPSSVRFDPAQVQALLLAAQSQAANLENGNKPQVAVAKEMIWTGSTNSNGLLSEGRITTKGDRVLNIEFELSTPRPPELTPEELVEGVERPWLRKVQASGVKVSEKVERVEGDSETPTTILIAETIARAYVDDSKGSSRFTALLRIELRRDIPNPDSSSEEEQGKEVVNKLSGKWRIMTKGARDIETTGLYLQKKSLNSYVLKVEGPIELEQLPFSLSDLTAAGEAGEKE